MTPTLLLFVLLSFSSCIFASDFLSPGGGKHPDYSDRATSSPVRQVSAVITDDVGTPEQQSIVVDSMDSEQLQKYRIGKTPAEIDPLNGQNLIKLIKGRKYLEVAGLIEDCLTGRSERAKESLKKKLRISTIFTINHATNVACIPIEYVALRYSNPKVGQESVQPEPIESLFFQLAKAHIQLLGSLPPSLDKLCEHKEALRSILMQCKGYIRDEARKEHEMVERPSYMASPGPADTSFNVFAIQGSEGSVFEMSTSFATTPGAGDSQAKSRLARSLFDDADDGAEVADNVSVLGRDATARELEDLGIGKRGASSKRSTLFSDDEDEFFNESHTPEQLVDVSAGSEEIDTPVLQAAPEEQREASRISEHYGSEQSQQSEQRGDKSPEKEDTTAEQRESPIEQKSAGFVDHEDKHQKQEQLVQHREQGESGSSFLKGINRKAVAAGVVIVAGLLIFGLKYRSSSVSSNE